MNKKYKYSLYGGAAGGVVNGILNVIRRNNEYPDQPINWSTVFKASLKGAVVGGTGGFIIGSYVDYKNSFERPLNTDLILGSMLTRFKLNHNDKKYQLLCEKADWLIKKIKEEFHGIIKGEPFRFGSTEDGTALREKYDIDFSISFEPEGFTSIIDMYEILESYVRKLEGKNGIIRVRKQNVSIGVFFDFGSGCEGKVDIVPIKITKRKDNCTSGYLHKNPSGLFSSHSYQKTDTYLLSRQKLSRTQKELLVALKKWKRTANIPISSHLLQNLILDAYYCNVNRVPRGLTKKIIMVLSHISENIDSLQLTSIENTNNVLTNIPDADKTIIKSACKKVIEDFRYQPNSIIDCFK